MALAMKIQAGRYQWRTVCILFLCNIGGMADAYGKGINDLVNFEPPQSQ